MYASNPYDGLLCSELEIESTQTSDNQTQTLKTQIWVLNSLKHTKYTAPTEYINSIVKMSESRNFHSYGENSFVSHEKWYLCFIVLENIVLLQKDIFSFHDLHTIMSVVRIFLYKQWNFLSIINASFHHIQ